MTEPPKPSHDKQSENAIFSELNRVQQLLRGDAAARINQTVFDGKPLLVSEFTRRALYELEALHQSLKKTPAHSMRSPSNFSHPMPSQSMHSQTMPSQSKSSDAVPTSNIQTNRSVARGTEEVQASLFDEPQAAPAAKPSTASVAETAAHNVGGAKQAKIDRLVDRLVADYLPEIEQRLRAELKRLLAEP